MIAFSNQSTSALSGDRTFAKPWPSHGAIIVAVGVILSVSGCSLTVDNATSGFASVVGSEIDRDMDGKVSRLVSNPDVGTVVLATGYELKAGLIYPSVTSYAYAGIAPEFDVGTAVYTGTTTYHAGYRYVEVDYETSFFGLHGAPRSYNGSIDLDADFIAGTLTGESGDLAVNGSIKGSGLSGTVTVQYSSYASPIVATLDGYIGETGTIGAFHGSDAETALAGGFIGTAQ